MDVMNVEESILGTILAWPEVFETIHTKIVPKYFLNDQYRHVFENIEKCYEAYGEIDAPTVALRCDKRKFKNVDMSIYFEDLRNYALSKNYLPEYGKYLSKRYKVTEFKSVVVESKLSEVSEENIDEVLLKLNKATEDITFSEKLSSFTKSFKSALNDSLKSMKERLLNGVAPGMPTHLNTLNDMIGSFKDGHLCFIAGTTGSGKSALVLDLFYNISKSQNKNVLIFSLEMTAEELVNRLIAQETHIPYDRIINGLITEGDLSKIERAIKDIEETKIMIIDEAGLNINDIQSRAKHYNFELKKKGEKLDAIIVDYLQLMSTTNSKKSATDVAVITEGTMGLKNLAKELNCHVACLSQFSRSISNRENPRPRTSDLKGSQSIEADSDELIFIYREIFNLFNNQPKAGTIEHEQWQAEVDAVADKTEIIIAKNRHGKMGSVFLGFNPEILHFYDLTQDFNSDILN